MAMSPRKMMAMGKKGEKKTKSAVKLRAGGMVKKMRNGGAVSESPRPKKRPDDLMEGFAIRRGNAADRLEASDYNEPLKSGGRKKRKMRMGGMVKK